MFPADEVSGKSSASFVSLDAGSRVTPTTEARPGGVLVDLLESGVRVVRRTRLPSWRGVVAFFGDQVLVSAVAWTAALVAAGLVKRFFEVRGLWNLWGLTASSSRTVVSADQYRMITGLMGYAAGLVMLVLVRHLLVRLIAEFHDLRLERLPRECASAAGARRPAHAPGTNMDGPVLELGD